MKGERGENKEKGDYGIDDFELVLPLHVLVVLR